MRILTQRTKKEKSFQEFLNREERNSILITTRRLHDTKLPQQIANF